MAELFPGMTVLGCYQFQLTRNSDLYVDEEELRELKSLDVLLPTREKVLRLRMVATPERELKALLQRLKILLPNRSIIIENVVEKMA